jgi:hypothetical protein
MGDWMHDVIEAAYKATQESPTAVRQLERALRAEWGGARVYIAKNPPTHRSDQRQRAPGRAFLDLKHH